MSASGSGAFGAPRLDFYSVTSTLDVAREQARRGAPHGTLITAVHQTAGRGRRGASWHDGGGMNGSGEASPEVEHFGDNSGGGESANALLTYLLRPMALDFPLRDTWQLPFLASLACVKALRSVGYREAKVKWPNDLVIGGKKTGGLLVESVLEGDPSGDDAPARVYLLGIGINVGQSEFPGAGSYAIAPTSLRLEGAGVERVPNATEVADLVTVHLELAWREYLPGSAGDGGAALIDDWRAYQMTGQTQAGVDCATGEPLAGTYLDVRALDGAAVVLLDVGDGVGAGRSAALMPNG